METTTMSKDAWVREVLELYERPLLRYAMSILGEAEQARDVVQDTFEKLCLVEPAAVKSHLKGWLYAVCRNRAFDVRKKEGRMRPIEEMEAEAHPAPGMTPRESAATKETHALVFRAVGKLPKDQQEAFRLKFNDGLSYREIAHVMGISLGTVSNWVTTALGSVRAELDALNAAAPEV